MADRRRRIIEPLIPVEKGDRAKTGSDTCPFVDVVLRPERGANLMRDLPPERGDWRTVRSQFRR